ncbi:PIR protein [Plasmodium yoelii]|uniref:Bir1 protein n=3 Tax=Plasmodium yoelii TaxID=5861 RepID=Q7RL86_PLAYO|nr:PIR protein [Plasmodium yoelii]EAA22137.1 putative bir1 protein [Plasmodium yoelii yoelii]WBY55807.1 PIR protein [Plasmodium yoelii yoelii]CDU16854.1 YIR protein [Plasmodium yoelii]VTZ74534.1 PIR protein [Plasmodium yoelii]|eukprot:XP_022811727.1 PIR protein [Plasmodium yoelii]
MGQNQTNDTEYFIKKDNKICSTFDTLRRFFPDKLKSSGEYNFKGTHYKDYFHNKSIYTDIDKINGYCLWLFNNILKKIYTCESKESCITLVVVYMLAWLSYKLNQKTNNGITKLNEFYSKYMENVDEYKKTIDGVTEYKNYIEFINKNNKLMDIDINVMSKFYNLFNNLCKMYNELSLTMNNKGEEYLKYVENFYKNYNDLINENFNDTNSKIFKRVLSVVSNDYDHIKRTLEVEFVRKQIPELPKEKTTQVSTIPKESEMHESLSEIPESSSGTEISTSDTELQNYETDKLNSETALSSSLIINKLIPIPFIFIVILILLGIARKYSLFGFRKRAQKHLREKLKK